MTILLTVSSAMVVVILGVFFLVRGLLFRDGDSLGDAVFLQTLTAQAVAAGYATPLPVDSFLTEIETATSTPVAFTATPEPGPTRTLVPVPSRTPSPTQKPPPTDTPTITPTPAPTFTPTAAVTGFELAFASDADGDFKLYLMNPDEPANWVKLFLPQKFQQAWWPSFCGDVIAAEVATTSGQPPQWIEFFDLSGTAKFSWEPPAGAFALGVPRCSPELNYFAYSVREGEDWHFYIDDLKTGNHVSIDTNLAGYASWNLLETNMFSMLKTGSDFVVRQITNFPNNTRPSTWKGGKYPAISPDGSQVAYFCSGTLNLCLANADGSNSVTLYDIIYKRLNNQPFPATAMWSADGEWIYFSSADRGNWDIYRIRPDGTGLENLTLGWNSEDVMPATQW